VYGFRSAKIIRRPVVMKLLTATCMAADGGEVTSGRVSRLAHAAALIGLQDQVQGFGCCLARFG
jgi:hypothetical protein